MSVFVVASSPALLLLIERLCCFGGRPARVSLRPVSPTGKTDSDVEGKRLDNISAVQVVSAFWNPGHSVASN